MRVLIADDEPTYRALLSAMLASSDDFQVVAEAGDGAEAIRLARELKPDLILMDVQMPRMNGVQAAAAIRASAPEIRIILISSHDEAELTRLAAATGTLLFISKSKFSLRRLRAELGL